MTDKKEIKKIIFYASHRTFRTILIGHLYEMCQVYPVVFLSEELDEETKKIIQDKKLFPKLEKIIFVNQITGPKKNIFKKNRDLHKLAKKVIDTYKPDIVVAPGDLYPFNMYLLRFAKRINALNISIQSGNAVYNDLVRKKVELTNAYLKFPKFLPLSVRIFLVRVRKYAGHILYHWIFPILVGEKPFLGKASFILREGEAGMRDADYQIVFSKRDSNIHHKVGVPDEKLYILKHPLERSKTLDFFKRKLLGMKADNDKIAKKAVTLLLPSEDIGFKGKDYSLISKEERLKTRIKIINSVAKLLPNWKIYLKPHPDIKDFDEKKIFFESVSKSVEVINPSEQVDKYIKISNAVIGIPRASTTVLFYTSLIFPKKIMISLDFDKELAGDFYKNYTGVEYIDNEEKFIKTLELIANNKYKKESKKSKKLEEKEFPDTNKMLDYFYETRSC